MSKEAYQEMISSIMAFHLDGKGAAIATSPVVRGLIFENGYAILPAAEKGQVLDPESYYLRKTEASDPFQSLTPTEPISGGCDLKVLMNKDGTPSSYDLELASQMTLESGVLIQKILSFLPEGQRDLYEALLASQSLRCFVSPKQGLELRNQDRECLLKINDQGLKSPLVGKKFEDTGGHWMMARGSKQIYPYRLSCTGSPFHFEVHVGVGKVGMILPETLSESEKSQSYRFVAGMTFCATDFPTINERLIALIWKGSFSSKDIRQIINPYFQAERITEESGE